MSNSRNTACAALLMLSFAITGLIGCVPGTTGDGEVTPGTIVTNPQPTLPGLTQGYVLTEGLLDSDFTGLQTSSLPHAFSFVLLEPTDFLTSYCMLGSGPEVFTVQVISTNFGFLHLINPDVDPHTISLFCGVEPLNLSLINGEFSQTTPDPVPLIVGENYITVPLEIQFEMHNGADYFLLITSPENVQHSYELVQSNPETGTGYEYSFYVPGLRAALLEGQDVKVRFLRRTSVNILDFIPTTVNILDPSQDPVPIEIDEETPVFLVNGGSGYHSFAIVQLDPDLEYNYQIWDCRFSISGVHSDEIYENAETYLVPPAYDPFDLMFYCSSTSTYHPNLVAEDLLDAPMDPVHMVVRGDYIEILDEALQAYLDSQPSNSPFMVVTRNTPGEMYPIDVVYPWPDDYHYPDLGEDAPYTFSYWRNLSEEILSGEDIQLHFFRIVDPNRVEKIPVILTIF